MTIPFLWERNEDYAWQSLDDSVVVLDFGRQKVYELNEGAAWLWNALDVPRSRQDLALTVALRHQIEFDDVYKDVDDFLEMASRLGLLHKKENLVKKLYKKLRKVVRILLP